jgi:hypothetical protein
VFPALLLQCENVIRVFVTPFPKTSDPRNEEAIASETPLLEFYGWILIFGPLIFSGTKKKRGKFFLDFSSIESAHFRN